LRVLEVAAADPGGRHVVLVPGLGALGYLLPTVRELGRRGIGCSLLDLPGFGAHDGCGATPTVEGVGRAVAHWCAGLPDGEQLILVGHSTGAQAALHAALALQDVRPPSALVLLGPTVAATQRSLARLIATAPLAYRRDSLRELSVLVDWRRAGRELVTLLRSAIADRPEREVRELRVPLVLAAGRQDAFVPADWLIALARAYGQGRDVPPAAVVRLPGSHNNPSTHPEEVADLIDSAAATLAAQAGRRRDPVPIGT
jgi:pimeloyl-ACP methyl ester carboxylesterase